MMKGTLAYYGLACSILSLTFALQHNLFYQTHNLLYGNRTVCYPLARSVRTLFAASPVSYPFEKLVKGSNNSHCQGTDGTFLVGGRGHCWSIRPPWHTAKNNTCQLGYHFKEYYPTSNTRRIHHQENKKCQFEHDKGTSYPLCHDGTGWACVLVNVTQNYTCVEQHCTGGYGCGLRGGVFTCQCLKWQCLNLASGLQMVCGQSNGTHLTRGNLTFSDPSWTFYYQYNRDHQPTSYNNTCYRTKKGYVFLFNGTFTTATRRLPTYFAIGVLGPITVPCPNEAWANQRIVARSVSKEFCEDWKNPKTLGSPVGYGILSSITLGGTAGVISTKNRNYLICGLTLLGNETAAAIDDINKELSELRLYAQQNRYALDYLLAQQGEDGVCTIIGDKCITNIRDHSYNISEHIDNIRTYVDGLREGPQVWWPFNWLGNLWGSMVHYGTILLLIIIILLLLRCVVPIFRSLCDMRKL